MNRNNEKIVLIRNFINAYNTFNINAMTADFHQDITFENITNGKTDLETNGIEEFTKQAEYAAGFFKERKITIVDIKFEEDTIKVLIDYFGILSKDIPGGPHAGDTLKLRGMSIYHFKDNKITGIQDIV